MLQRGYLDVMGSIAAISIPAGVGIAACADLLIPILFGEQWTHAIPLVVVLSLYGVIVAIKSNNHYVYLALGKPKLTTLLGVAQISFLLPMLMICSVKWGVYGAALAFLFAQILFTPISYVVLLKVLSLRVNDLVYTFVRPIIAVFIMYIAVRFAIHILNTSLEGTLPLILSLIICVVVGAIIYTSFMYIMWYIWGKPLSIERHILTLFDTKVRSRFRRHKSINV